MRKLLGLVIAIPLVCLLAWVLSRREHAPQVTAPTSTESAIALEPKPVELSALERTTTAPDAAPESTRAPAVVVPPAGAAPPRPELTEIRGRFLLSSGAPANDVLVKLKGYTSNDELVRRYGVSDDWKDVAVTSGSDGRFSITFDPPRAYQFFLETELEGHCQANWRWGTIERHSVVDVGDVTLVRGGSIRARIVDKDGRVLTSGWSVYADAELRDHSNGRDETRARAHYSSPKEGFLLGGLPPGRVHLQAYSEIANWVKGPTVDVVEGQVTPADIIYNEPDVGSRISVSVVTNPFYTFEFDDDFVFLLTGPGIEERRASKVANSSQLFTFPDLPAGLYRVELRDDRFQPWSKSDVKPGSSLTAKLKGNAAAVLKVIDDATLEPVTRYALDVRFDGDRSSSNVVRVLEAKRTPPADGRFAGLVPVPQTFIVRAEGYSSCELALTDLKPNEERSITARLVRASGLSGRVISGPGRTPIERAVVSLVPVRPESSSGLRRNPEYDPDAFSTETDAGGRFEAPSVSAGKYTLTASLNRFFLVEQELIVKPAAAALDVELALPARAWLAGKLLAPEGTSFSGLSVIAIPAAVLEKNPYAERQRIYHKKDDAAADIGADGTFRLGPLPAGEVRVTVRMPDTNFSTGPSGWSTMSGQGIDVGSVRLEAGRETAHEFDFHAVLPGTIEVLATVDGRPASAFVVNIDQAGRGTATRLQLDAQGTAKSKPIAPGEYAITLFPEGSNLACVLKQGHVLAPGEAAKVELTVRIVSGTVRLLDAVTGRPLANQRVTISTEEKGYGFGSSFDSDAEGRLSLRLPVGRYRAAIANEHNTIGPDAAGFEWTEKGPASPELRLSAK